MFKKRAKSNINPGMTLSEELTWRGFINQTTLPKLDALDKKKWTFYHGFDASADSQTVGNLAAMMLDKAFLRHGHKAIILAGGATSLIGDPGGKEAERPLQSEKTIARNVAIAKKQLKSVLSGHKFMLVNNLDWTKGMTVIPFLRDIGKHFSMTPLVQRDYIARRLGEDSAGISYAEFGYTILQGMDYLHLYDTYGCTLQLGGSDQWGNCLSGVELIRRARGAEAHALTLPLVLNKATGKKFGKTEDGAIWLDPKKTSPNEFYQFWINADDAGVEGYLKIYTELSKSAVDKIMADFTKDKAGRIAQKALAYEVTKIVHGEGAAKTAQKHAHTLREKTPGNVAELAMPTLEVAKGSAIIDALVASELVSSKNQARQLLGAGAIYINDKQITKDIFEASDFNNGLLKLRKGKALSNTVIIKQK